jgi:protoheme IX farnesyltransferase
VAQDAPLSASRSPAPPGTGRPPAAALRDLAILAKLPISLLSALSAATGFVAFGREARPPLLAAAAGTLLLAAGAAALNELIDRDRDARMERTRRRPIPSGRISPRAALAFAAAAGTAGAAVLWRFAGPLPALLGAAAFAWYDGVYTPLKRVTAWAVLPGAVVGALPPAIGWAAAGGQLLDPRLHALAAFLALWQVPHFWLLALRHAGDYRRGGFPTPASRFSPSQIGRITLGWVLSTGGAALLLPLFGVTRGNLSPLGLALATGLLVPFAAALGRVGERPAALGRGFAAVNLFALAVMILVAADALS